MGITIFSIVVLLINLLGIKLFVRQPEDKMESMVITMGLSSSFGLAIGFLIWFHFYNQPLISTLLAIAIASFIGIFIGIKLGANAQIEGLFSGLMASMMAVMLILMLDFKDGVFLIMLSLAFLSGITTLSIARSYGLSYKLLILSCIVMTVIFISFPKDKVNEQINNNYHSDH